MRVLFLAAVLALFVQSVSAQDQAVITAENLSRVQSALHLDFDRLDLTVGSGIFVMNADASIIVTFANAPDASPLSTAVIWDGITGNIKGSLFIGENQFYRTLSADGKKLAVAIQSGALVFDLETGESHQLLASAGPLLSVWFTRDNVICGETAPDLEGQAFILCSDGRDPVPLFGGASLDFVRIGRVPPPLSVTSSGDGTANLWNLETGEILAQANVGEIAAFGAINFAGTHLAWRDPLSQGLNLLEVATGDNRQIAPLGGAYIAHIILSRDADVIFGIDPFSARGHVWAWLTATGEKVDLGRYRACQRQQPDLAQLSADGTALVIGCDSGIDVWRVGSTSE